jgi:methionyl-tRNA synthetase
MKKFYITTSIPYTNAAPHIGFALEAVQADVLARYNTKLKKDVYFLTGTDEHGLKIKKAAEAVGKSPKQFVDEISAKFLNLTKVLNISNTDFIRTTDEERHIPAVQKIWQELDKNGDIYQKRYSGWYCAGCEAFVTEKELINGQCPIHKKEPELIEEENYFFKLSKYLPEIKKQIEKNSLSIIPESKKKEVLGFISTGMEDVSFSRSKDKYWGIPVPGDESQVIYVWGDALPNYISAIGYSTDKKKFKKYWPANMHCIGKDILKFHAIIWPAMLLSLKLKLPECIFVHGFIGVNGQKMSKSLGNIVDPFELISKYGADAVRYYLLREISPTEDGDFSIDKFEARYNSDLASGIGNLVSRIEALKKKIGINSKVSKEFKTTAKKAEQDCVYALESLRFNEALKIILIFAGFCDKKIEQEKPWENRENSKQVIADLDFAVAKIGDLLEPFLPETSEKIKRRAVPLFPRIQ